MKIFEVIYIESAKKSVQPILNDFFQRQPLIRHATVTVRQERCEHTKRDVPMAGQNARSPEDSLQFANVPRPGVIGEAFEGPFRQPGGANPMFAAELFQHVSDNERKII